ELVATPRMSTLKKIWRLASWLAVVLGLLVAMPWSGAPVPARYAGLAFAVVAGIGLVLDVDRKPRPVALYAVHPGITTNRVEPRVLARLYELKPGEWILWDSAVPDTFRGRNWDDYVHLYPSPRGSYGRPDPTLKRGRL